MGRELLHEELCVELGVIVRRDVLLILFQGLVAEVAAIYQEEHATRAREFNKAVDEVNRRERLAAAGGHLDQGARTILSQRLFEIVNGYDLGWPEACGAQ